MSLKTILNLGTMGKFREGWVGFTELLFEGGGHIGCFQYFKIPFKNVPSVQVPSMCEGGGNECPRPGFTHLPSNAGLIMMKMD